MFYNDVSAIFCKLSRNNISQRNVVSFYNFLKHEPVRSIISKNSTCAANAKSLIIRVFQILNTWKVYKCHSYGHK